VPRDFNCNRLHSRSRSSLVMIVLGSKGCPCKRKTPNAQEGCVVRTEVTRSMRLFDRLPSARDACARKEAHRHGPWLPPLASPATKFAPEERRRRPPGGSGSQHLCCSQLSLTLLQLQWESPFLSLREMRCALGSGNEHCWAGTTCYSATAN